MGRLESFNLTANTDIADYFDASLVSTADLARSQVTWTQADVVDLMEAVYPPPSGRPGDQSVLRQQLSSAFLAGVAQFQEEFLLKPSRSLALASIQAARALLNNRA